MCEHGKTVEVVNLLANNGDWHRRTWAIDSCIADLIVALNNGGIDTVASCCGHGKASGRIDLADGRILLMPGNRITKTPNRHRLPMPDKDGEQYVPHKENCPVCHGKLAAETVADDMTNRELLVIHLLANVDGLTAEVAGKCADAFIELLDPFVHQLDWESSRKMRLRNPCRHDLYESHYIGQGHYSNDWCPGGEYLSEDALIVEKVDGEWPEWATTVLYGMIRRDLYPESYVLDGLAKANPNQVGEPG